MHTAYPAGVAATPEGLTPVAPGHLPPPGLAGAQDYISLARLLHNS